MSKNHPPSNRQPIPAVSEFELDELVRLIVALDGYNPQRNGRNEQLDRDQERKEEIFNKYRDKGANDNDIYQQIINHLTKKLILQDHMIKQQQRDNANQNIVDSQSQTINLIRKILRKIYPDLKLTLKHPKNKKEPNVPFLLLNDGHILFSKNNLKNQTQIVSTPLLFRPLFNPILHHLLQFILRYFSKDSTEKHPGAVFSITGDQGIGKTSLMLILMSALSECNLGYYYRKGTDGDTATEFISTKDENGDVVFTKLKREGEPAARIRIYDDNLPFQIPNKGTLSIIFTSPDPNRLKNNLSKSFRHFIFRLPTFSLAEDAVAMVGCTPTVPFALLSPEDMELRKEEQEILLSIEREKEERARQLPSELERPKMSSEQEAAAQLIKYLAKNPNPLITKWDDVVTNVVKRLLDHPSLNQEHHPILHAFLINLTEQFGKRNSTVELLKSFRADSQKKDPHSPQPAPTQKEDSSRTEEDEWKEVTEQLTRLLTPTDNSKSSDNENGETAKRPNFSEMEDTPESIVRYISVYLGPQNFNTFHLSLYRSIVESRDEPTDEKRFHKIVSDWIRHFDITSGRDEEQTPTVTQAQIGKQLLTELILSDPTMPKEGLTDDELITMGTNHFFEHVLAKLPPPPDVQAETRDFSASLLHSLQTNQPALPVSSKSTVPLNAQLVNLKKHINEKDTDDFKIRQELRKKVELIKKGIEDGEGTTKDDEDKARINRFDTACDTLFDTLIDMIITPPPYDSYQHTLPSLFDLPISIHSSDTAFRNSLIRLLTKPSEDIQPEEELRIIVQKLVQ
ncbi:hypothetical protein BLNAU_17586 [Blattamonas nauphoetae]|uniref:Uncharacterized protein n=1 Tax=Blattamonas nauphoetae TaxID=2049346 RepID=A0ABQ9XB94_9EUKA|nr:hypothetical protein BLNAU_17586 [Blattamonas nauphoetae]